MKLTRDEELQRYRIYIWSSGVRLPTFDLERYYTEMPTREMIALRDKTVRDLERHPDFAPRFYGEFAEYLNSKLARRRTLQDWIWRTIVLKIDIMIWRFRNERTN